MDGGVIVATLSLALSTSLAIFYLRDRRQAKFSLENDYANCLLAWHNEVVELLTQAKMLKKDRDGAEHCADLAKLSALIEQGRFYFPNILKNDGLGIDKPPAYRGYRNLALDFLVASFNLLHEPPSDDCCDKLGLLQRHFTSIVFELVRPKKRLEEIRALTDRYFTTDQCFEDFLDTKDGAVLEYIWRAPISQRIRALHPNERADAPVA